MLDETVLIELLEIKCIFFRLIYCVSWKVYVYNQSIHKWYIFSGLKTAMLHVSHTEARWPSGLKVPNSGVPKRVTLSSNPIGSNCVLDHDHDTFFIVLVNTQKAVSRHD